MTNSVRMMGKNTEKDGEGKGGDKNRRSDRKRYKKAVGEKEKDLHVNA